MPKIADRYLRVMVYITQAEKALYERLRAEAFRRHIGLSALVLEYIRRGLEKEETK